MSKTLYLNKRQAQNGDLAIVNHGGVILVGTVQHIKTDAITSNAQLARIDHANGGGTARPVITLSQALHADDAWPFIAGQAQLADDVATALKLQETERVLEDTRVDLADTRIKGENRELALTNELTTTKAALEEALKSKTESAPAAAPDANG